MDSLPHCRGMLRVAFLVLLFIVGSAIGCNKKFPKYDCSTWNGHKLYLWEPRYFSGSVGHLSLGMNDGTYVSFWPEKMSAWRFILSKKGKDSTAKITLDDDKREMKRDPDQVFEIPAEVVDPHKISSWWDEFQSRVLAGDNSKRYQLLIRNCAIVVNKAVHEGLAYTPSEKEWKKYRDFRLLFPGGGTPDPPNITPASIYSRIKYVANRWKDEGCRFSYDAWSDMEDILTNTRPAMAVAYN